MIVMHDLIAITVIMPFTIALLFLLADVIITTIAT